MKNLDYTSKVVCLRTAVIAPEDLLAECKQSTPATVAAALQTAEIALSEDLRVDLDGFPYRDQPAAPRAVWARFHAVALERVRSAMRANGIGKV